MIKQKHEEEVHIKTQIYENILNNYVTLQQVVGRIKFRFKFLNTFSP